MYSHSKNDVVDCSIIMVCHGLTGIFIYTTFLYVAQREQIYIVDHASNTQQSHTVTYSHYSHYSHCDYSHFSVSLQSPQYSNYSRVCDAVLRRSTAPSLCRRCAVRLWLVHPSTQWLDELVALHGAGASVLVAGCWLLSWHGLACCWLPRYAKMPSVSIIWKSCWRSAWKDNKHNKMRLGLWCVEHDGACGASWGIPGAVKNNRIYYWIILLPLQLMATTSTLLTVSLEPSAKPHTKKSYEQWMWMNVGKYDI